MRKVRYLIACCVFVLFACSENSTEHARALTYESERDEKVTPKAEIAFNHSWQEGFGLTHNPEIDSIWFKPVSFYISDENCSALAIDFYYGLRRPSDNDSTTQLLKLAETNNAKLRPFYRWCLNKTILIADGALGEMIGVPARRYAEKFPDEFFKYMDIETNKEKYDKWTSAISYSGYFDYPNWSDAQESKKRFETTMLKNLKVKSKENTDRVRKFVKDAESIE